MSLKPLLLACALGLSVCAHAQQQGMTVVRDPETGKLRAPTSAELRAMQATQGQARSMAPPPQSTVRADGTRALALGERGMVYSVVQRAADGSILRRCVKDGQAIVDGKEGDHEHR